MVVASVPSPLEKVEQASNKSLAELTEEAVEVVQRRVLEILEKRFGDDREAKIQGILKELSSNKWPPGGIAETALNRILSDLLRGRRSE